MKKFLCCLSVLLLISSCAIAPRPKTENPAKVTFDFSGNGKSALTFWRKLNNDGSKGKVFSVGGTSKFALILNMRFNYPYAETITLDAGTYFLDSFQIVYEDGFIVSEFNPYAFRNGLDNDGKPKYLSFEVKDGKNLVLPRVDIIVDNYGKKNQSVKFNFEDKKKVFNIGSVIKNN